ncbi:MAG TPA: hypothetical protein VLX28_13020 [Thermoanaerobaculia bacterium]|nr:hypothetical protein [Thermoanaerobaculia bacterium]
MLRLVLLVLYLAASLSASTHTKIGGGLDPDGLTAHTVDGGGGLDPDGLTAQTAGDLTGNLDPNG